MIKKPTPTLLGFTEIGAMTALGSLALATSQAGRASVSYQSGPAGTVSGLFVEAASLDATTPIYGTGNETTFAQKLSRVSSTSTSYVTVAMKQYRDDVIDYLGNDQVGFLKSRYNTGLNTINGFLKDYKSAYAQSQILDKAILQNKFIL